MQFLLALQIRRFVMRKLLVGMVALISSVGGVSACRSHDKTEVKTPVTQTAGMPVQNVQSVQKTDVRPAGTFETASKTPRLTLVLGEGKGGFKFRSVMLSDEAKAKIDEMFTGDKFDLKDAHFEIEGYTDNLGTKEVNDQVGLARAEAVRLYLGEQYEIPGNCIRVVSYGMEKPAADNSTPEGRAKNRRVVIKVVDKVVD
jgi:outer membrane protein OmpA-like peptidoglycan-associated protein